MEDLEIVQLYWERNQEAISATAEKYGNYCTSIARNILDSQEDVEECVNDSYLNAWNAMPPHRPKVLSAFLGKITRNLAFDKYRHNRAGKRGGGNFFAILDELSECVSGKEDVWQEIDKRELVRAIDAFLDTLPREKREIFVCRYWYSDSISDIAKRQNMREGTVSMTLGRLRLKLRNYLSERGFEI